jgi:radical SAM protein with 4Fe4S-binding SPASM domain
MRQDKFKIDSHKLTEHPARVAAWLGALNNVKKQKNIYPIYVEISPSGLCNHRCIFCALDFTKYNTPPLKYAVLKKTLGQMAKLGIKSVMFAGEGEPLLHKDLPKLIKYCAKIKIDTAITTNFTCANPKTIETLLKYCKWIKVSLNAASENSYAKIHRAPKGDFDKVINNMKLAAKIKKQKNYKCTLGTQALLIADNAKSMPALAQIVKKAGFDYFVVKPYSQHPKSITAKYAGTNYKKYMPLEKMLSRYNSKTFQVIFRSGTINNLFKENYYQKVCHAVPFFWAYISSDGSVYGCSAFLGDKKFNYGNINKQTFKEIWQSSKRAASIKHLKNKKVLSGCRLNCRMEAANKYLNGLVTPQEHVNFI